VFWLSILFEEIMKSLIFSKPTASDISSGLFVFLIALPLCLGISVASGFPALSGVVTAIVGGLATGFLGGSRLTIKGPAAGMIVIALGAATELAVPNSPMSGVAGALAVSFVAGGLQIIIGVLGLGSLAALIPVSVIHGMMSAIGLIIIGKQLHVALGVVPLAKTPFGLYAELPQSIVSMNPLIMLIGALSFGIMLYYPLVMKQIAKKIPNAIVALIVGIGIAAYCQISNPHHYQFLGGSYHLDQSYLVGLPRELFASLPSWDWSASATWPFIKYVLLFTLVGSIESALTVSAIDTIDPKHQTADVSKDLVAVGAANMLAGYFGGLPMISEVVRSKANVDAGAQTYWSNFLHGALLLISVLLLPGVLGMIPSAALAGMLVFVGARLASYKELLHMKHLGLEQLTFFLITLFLTVTVDILAGVIAGVIAAVVFCVIKGKAFKGLFRLSSQVIASSEGVVLAIDGNASFLNIGALTAVFHSLADSNSRLTVDVSKASLVEHSFIAKINQLSCGYPNCAVSIVGLDMQKRAMTDHPESTRFRA
jgi:MFS superfamily sulfate permease-like transporter